MISYLLQAPPFEWQQQDPVSIIIGIGLLLIFVGLLVLGGLRKGSGSGQASATKPKKYSKRNFHRAAEVLGLSRMEINTLEHLISIYNISNPAALLSNTPTLDNTLKRALSSVDQQIANDSVKEGQKLTLYSIKQKIERSGTKKQNLTATNTIKPGQEVNLSINSEEKYPSKLVSNMRDGLAFKIPVNSQGGQIRWKKWTPVTVFFSKPNGEGYSFNTKVIGYITAMSTHCLLLQQVKKITEAQQRRYRRKSLEKPAYFYPIRIVTTGYGKKQEKKAMVESTRGSLGTVIEVSSGGCSVKSSYPLSKGDLIKVEFETYKGTHISVLGKIRNTRRLRPLGGIMHIRFTKVSQKNLNKINSYIYSLDTEKLIRRSK